MPITLIVFAFLSLLGTASGAALLVSNFGVLTITSPLVVWLMFLFFSVTGPLGILMAAQRPGRLLFALGFAFTLLGLASLTAVFAAAVGITQILLPMAELLLLAFLCLTGGVSMVAAGRGAIATTH